MRYRSYHCLVINSPLFILTILLSSDQLLATVSEFRFSFVNKNYNTNQSKSDGIQSLAKGDHWLNSNLPIRIKFIRNKRELRLSPAKIIEPPANVRVISGETALFFCHVSGNPTPTVNFLLDRQVSHRTPGVGGVLNIPDGSLLRLTKVRREQNGLQVQCIARNHIGRDTATAYLTVYDANDRLPDGYPIIHVPPKASSAAVGDVARLDCEVTGRPQPNVIWLKNEIPIQTIGQRTTLVGTGSLLFEHLLLSDEGHYECLVTNTVGSVLSSKAYLRVKNTYFVPKIIDKVDQVGVRLGHGANLTCRAAGNPTPSTRWLTNNERPITEPNDGISVLFLADITEPARYICEANNSLGTVQHPVRVHIIEVPPSPTALVCLEKGPDYAFLQWLPPKPSLKPNSKQSGPVAVVDSYTLFLTEYENAQTISTKKQLTNISVRQFHLNGIVQYKLTGLKAYTRYSVEVTAVNNVLGMSDPSNTVNFVTKELPPNSVPLSVETVALSDDSVLVSWKPPKETNGKIIGYNVFYSRNSQAPLIQWQKSETNYESIKLHNLYSSETYYVRLNARNSAGEGPLTDAFPVMVKFGIPSQPREFMGYTYSPKQILLTWIAPTLPSEVALQDYILRYRKADHSNTKAQPIEIPITSDITEFVLDNLQPNSTYHISLAARTKFGTGIAAQIKVHTDPNVPATPILQEISILDSSSIRVRWFAPSSILEKLNQSRPISKALTSIERPSKVQYFLIQWAQFPFTDWEQSKIAISDNIATQQNYEYIIHGLISRTSYRIRIIAVGSGGMGQALELGPIRTKGQVPSAPRNLRLNQLRRATPPGASDPKADYAILELAWDPPERTHGDIRGYQVMHRLIAPLDLYYQSVNREDGLATKPVIRNVTQTAYTSTYTDGIKFGRTYRFEVAAYNGVDLGLPAQLNISTPEDVPGSFPLHVRVKGLSATAIEVTWSPPSRQKWNEEITNYQVRYFQPSAPNETEVLTNVQEPRLQINNLKERTFYTVVVRAMTKNGPGPWSAASTIRTTAELPEPPSQISGLRINPRQIKVTWNTIPVGPTSKPQIPITGFRLFYWANENTHDMNTRRILDVGPVTMATLDALDPLRDYVIRIKSRGADRRYGRLSEPVYVGTYNPGEMIGNNKQTVSSGTKSEDERRISQLSCNWVQALESAKPGEASLKISWKRPAQVEGLYQFEIQLLGSKTYVDEQNHPHRVLYEPRSVEVTLSMLEQSAGSSFNTQLGFLEPNPTEQTQYELVIDALEANTVYDVKIKPVFTRNGQTTFNDDSSPSGHTSCRTQMLPPLIVPQPIPVAVKQQTGQVVMRVFRVSENLGRIRRYYLVTVKATDSDNQDITPNSKEYNWPKKMREASQSWDPRIFIAAEYSQEAFMESHLEILLSSAVLNRLRRSSLQTNLFNKTEERSPIQMKTAIESEKSTSSYLPEVLVYGKQFNMHQKYRAFTLACIYPNIQSNTQDSNVMSPIGSIIDTPLPSREPSLLEEEDHFKPELCTASKFSLSFQPDQPFAYSEKQLSEMNRENQQSGLVNNPDQPIEVDGLITKLTGGADLFTILLIGVISILSIVATVCIAVGCFVRRRRAKPIDNDLSITLNPSDGMLKAPLMPHSVQSFTGPNGMIEHDQLDTQTSEMIQQSRYTMEHPTPTHDRMRQAITTSNLAKHVSLLKQDNGLGMSDEYEGVESRTDLTWKHANMEMNRPKNRYANVIAYDHSRVILSPIHDQSETDYINANYIDGYQMKNAYIATQGPLPETFYDFWRMIWEQKSRLIVMMTRLEERACVKCDQYWPSKGKETYTYQTPKGQTHFDTLNIPSYTVLLKDTNEFAYYTLRTFVLQRNVYSKETDLNQHSNVNMSVDVSTLQDQREIKQFQFTAWPDYGTPDYPQPLLLFIRRVGQIRTQIMHQIQQEKLMNGDVESVRDYKTSNIDTNLLHNKLLSDEIGPVVVHCSAGVGRTGAFIAIDSQLERLKHENSVDIFSAVGRMRAQRNFMVQTLEQYTFLYDVFVEAAEVNGTEVTAHGLYNHVVKLRQPVPTCVLARYNLLPNLSNDTGGTLTHTNPSIKISSLELEFKRLDQNLLNKRQVSAAILPENQMKNRNMEVLPFESNRVCLPTICGLPGSDYINASFIDGYRKKRAYIATQTPSPNTTDDFWRLIWEYNSPIIVAFCDTHEPNGRLLKTSDQYWPNDRSARYQNLMVEPMVEYNMPHFILREFRITDTRDGQSRTLRQFQLHGWPQESTVPKSADAIIDLIGQVHKTQTQFGQDGPITVHCNTGSGRTGVFICLSSLLERMRCEGMVDIFLITRMLRTQRNQTIQTSDQYAFCYAATLEYLASFDHYMS